MGEYECLKIEHQLCFPLYACSKEVIRKYKPFLDAVDLTYTQYITMMILWEAYEKEPGKGVHVKELGERLYLDSGTLTPLLKKLEAKGLIRRTRSEEDERSLDVTATEQGIALREKAAEIPAKIGACIPLSADEAAALYTLLYKALGKPVSPAP